MIRWENYMDKILLPKTYSTPEIIIDPENEVLIILGVSVPDNAYLFYKPVRDSLKKYKEIKSQIVFNIHLKVFNSGSSRCILGLLFEASKYEGNFKKASVNWYFDEGDDEVRKTGEDFEEISKLEFKFHEVH